MRIAWRGHAIELRNEPTYTVGSADNVRAYGHEIILGDLKKRPTSCYGVSLDRDGREIASCVVVASHGPTTVHGRSAVVSADWLFLAIGNELCALKLPSLGLDWHVEADVATCFGVMAVPGQEGLISHGELEIIRLGFDGTVVWRQAGRDIFSGTLTVDSTGVQVTDWNGEAYWFDLATGESSRHEA